MGVQLLLWVDVELMYLRVIILTLRTRSLIVIALVPPQVVDTREKPMALNGISGNRVSTPLGLVLDRMVYHMVVMVCMEPTVEDTVGLCRAKGKRDHHSNHGLVTIQASSEMAAAAHRHLLRRLQCLTHHQYPRRRLTHHQYPRRRQNGSAIVPKTM